MAIDVNKVGNYNGKSFLGNSSAKPIVGIPLRTIYSYDITQGKLTLGASGPIPPGSPIKATNKVDSTTSSGKALNPNVLKIESAGKDADVSGFLLVNETDILDFGATAPRAYDGQIVNVALLGSRVEIYLPVDTTVAEINVNSKLAWDFTGKVLKSSTTGKIELLSPVVDGIKFEYKNDDVVYTNCKVAKVRL